MSVKTRDLPKNKLKRYIRSKDENYLKKREKYSKLPSVVNRRQQLGSRRRKSSTYLITLARTNGIEFTNKAYTKIDVILNRLVCEYEGKKYALRVDKEGKIYKTEYNTLAELDALPELDKPVRTKAQKEFRRLLKKYKKGDPEVLKLLDTKPSYHTWLQNKEEVEKMLKEKGTTKTDSMSSSSDESEAETDSESDSKIEENGSRKKRKLSPEPPSTDSTPTCIDPGPPCN